MTEEEELIELRQKNSLQQEQIQLLQEQVSQLTEQVKTLQERLAKDSHNSSSPPSSDRFSRQKKSRSLREKSGKKAGGQEGHKGYTLEMSDTPDETIPLPVLQCQHCQADLSAMAGSLERRQVVDVPLPVCRVIEYQGEWKQCPHCQGYTSTTFPDGVNAAVQYGPRVGAIAVYLLMQQLLPWGRACEVLADLLGVQVSEGTLARLIERTARHLVPVEEQIKGALSKAEVIHQDETGLYVKNRRVWMHGTSTKKLTHYQVHPSRGKKALDANGILSCFTGVSVHDCWAAYFRYGCHHALCLVHILRELTFLAEELGLWWAAKLKRLLLEMKQASRPGAQIRSVVSLSPRGDDVHHALPGTARRRGSGPSSCPHACWETRQSQTASRSQSVGSPAQVPGRRFALSQQLAGSF